MRHILLVFFSICLGASIDASAVTAAPATLTGKVTDAAGPLSGARVVVWHAYPRVGPAYYCPSCYIDCGKSVQTDAAGDYTINGLDANLEFEILVVAKGHIPKVSTKIDPSKGAAKTVNLKSRDIASLMPRQVVRGRILGPQGDPVVGALVEPQMVMYLDGSGMGGGVEGLDELAVTDDQGEFALASEKPCDAMDLVVTARTLAKSCFPHLVSGAKVHELKLIEGAVVTGRILRDGRPVAGVEVGLCPTNRSMGGCFFHETIATNTDGRFSFVNIPLGGDHLVYTLHDTMPVPGCLPPKMLKVVKDGETVDLGDLSLTAGHRVSGRFIAPAGQEIPKSSKIMLSHNAAWDSMVFDLRADGTFEFVDLPAGVYSVSFAGKGLWISRDNASFDSMNLNMVGKVDRDLENLTISLTAERPMPMRPTIPSNPGQRELEGAERVEK